jgi:hypothetical protein
MRIRRRSRPKTRGSWTLERSKLAHAAKARKRIERMQCGEVDEESQRVPEGKPLGVLTWHAIDGTVRRWVVTQGPRANNIGVTARVAGGDETRRVMGWDKLLSGLRKRLAIPKRVLR